MDLQQVQKEALLSLRRFYRSDFQKERASEAERKALAEAPVPVTNEIAQDFAAWRKSLLWASAVGFSVLTLLSFFSFTNAEDGVRQSLAAAQPPGQIAQFIQSLGRENLQTLDDITLTLALPYGVAAVMAFLAAMSWLDTRKSRRLARYGYLIMFATPFLIAMIPITGMVLDFEHLRGNEQLESYVKQLFGTYFGGTLFLIIGPRALALFPGIIRSSMGLKTLVPESPIPGWVAAIISPLYAIFMVVLFVPLTQTVGDPFLILGMLGFMAAPLVYVVFAKDILRPHSAGEVSEVLGNVRRISGICLLVGLFGISIFLLMTTQFGFMDILKFLFSVLGNVFLLSVVSSDFFLAMLHAGHQQTAKFHGTDLEKELDARFAALSEVGFTDLQTRGSAADAESPGSGDAPGD